MLNRMTQTRSAKANRLNNSARSLVVMTNGNMGTSALRIRPEHSIPISFEHASHERPALASLESTLRRRNPLWLGTDRLRYVDCSVSSRCKRPAGYQRQVQSVADRDSRSNRTMNSVGKRQVWRVAGLTSPAVGRAAFGRPNTGG